ncbi:hypothetical protein LX32DRAFT_236142 [Colletotrichum zoysiae]|uniref:Uncharacterized protein n=1 Tax=Colletotrichum zoysiae TaxID=1216348 RepID=A0AAD9HPT2_9PEZI|nr:hypothetical protein LX32DRAFT_236142 [Colletotrichum zoysiae]
MAVSRAPHHHHHIHWAESLASDARIKMSSPPASSLSFCWPSSLHPHLVPSSPSSPPSSSSSRCLPVCLSLCYCLHILESKTKVIHLDLDTLVSLNAANLSLLHSTLSAFQTSSPANISKHPNLWSWPPPSSPTKHLL